MGFIQQTYYEILEVDREADLQSLQRAYQRAKATYSPESGALYSMFSPEEAKELQRLVDEAYSVLSNPRAREQYDRTLTGAFTSDLEVSGEQDIFGISSDNGPRQDNPPDFPSAELNMGGLDFEASPSIEAQGNQMVSEPNIVQAQIPQPDTDGDFGTTRFGSYQIKPEIEQEIDEQQLFDGSFLQKIREYKNVTVDQICQHTKIGKHHIKGIEQNDFSSLPPSVFVRSFVKQYAKLLGLNEDKTADSFMAIYKKSRG
ncbi:MAG: helix-turn-helix domain-containing protein [Bdellovibrionales bacterium]